MWLLFYLFVQYRQLINVLTYTQSIDLWSHRSRADMYKNITPDYYGYRDEDDGILVIKEAEREVQYVWCVCMYSCVCTWSYCKTEFTPVYLTHNLECQIVKWIERLSFCWLASSLLFKTVTISFRRMQYNVTQEVHLVISLVCTHTMPLFHYQWPVL